jgi:ribosome biogenesis GTPase / thiamine phosphate phosphatase
MMDFDFAALQRVGFSQALVTEIVGLPVDVTENAQLFRVVELHRETVVLHDGRATLGARILPRLHRELADAGTALAVGDWVLARADNTHDVWAHARIAPLNHLVRRDGSGQRHPVVSNVDTALLVMGLDGDFSPRRLERFLALAHGSEAMPVVVLTKADVCEDVEAQLDALCARVPAEVPIHAMDARDVNAVRVLQPYCARGQTLVLLGSSGAGKSTLTNSLLGAAIQDTGATREHDSRGKHTTTARSMHIIPDGACIIDTPGVRTLQPDVDEHTLAASYEDIQALALHCKFSDCAHHDEPGCAVREGVGTDRLKNFHKMLREAQRETMSALERQQQRAQWKARGKAGRTRMLEKQRIL